MESGRLQKIKQNNKGFSLVELLCAVAIFGLVTAAISTIVVVSTRVYNNGVTETAVQQESQLAANRIAEIIKDAVSATLDGGDSSKLKIMKNDTEGYVVYLKEDSDKKTGNLIYQELEYESSGSGAATLKSESDEAVLAGNITKFEADVSEFKTSRIVKVTFEMEDNGRSYSANYVMTARNEEVKNIDTTLAVYVSASCPSELYLEPGQTFKMEIQTSGNVNDVVLDSNLDTLKSSLGFEDVEVIAPTKENGNSTYIAKIKIANNVKADNLTRELRFKVSYKDTSGNTVAYAYQKTNIYIRRVNGITLNYVVDTTGTIDTKYEGLYEGAGTVFTFYANIDDQNTRKNVNSDGEAFKYYKSTKDVDWSVSGEISSKDGDRELSKEELEKYIKVEKGTDTERPLIKCEVLEDMPAGFSFTVTAVSRHQTGVDESNKSNAMYGDKDGNLKDADNNDVKIQDSVTIKARDAKIGADNVVNVTLEPNEPYTYDLKIIGSFSMSDLGYTLVGSSDGTTSVEFNESKRTVTVTPGNNEKGGNGNGTPYEFDVLITYKGKTTPAVKIHVYMSRMDSLVVESVDGAHGAFTTYDIRARYNVEKTSGGVDVDAMKLDLKPTFYYRMSEEYAAAPDTATTDANTGITPKTKSDIIQDVSNAYTVLISWELTDENNRIVSYTDSKGKNIDCKGEIVTVGCVMVDGKVRIGTKEIKNTDANQDTIYYKIEHIKPARVEVTVTEEKDKDTGKVIKTTYEPKLTQMTELDVTPQYTVTDNKGNTTYAGLPAGYTFTITMRALNPTGTYTDSGSKIYTNRKNSPYNDGEVKDSYEIKSDFEIETPTGYIVVERGQGITPEDGVEQKDYVWDGIGADNEIDVPISIKGNAAVSMNVEILGSKDRDTKVAYKYAPGAELKTEEITVTQNGEKVTQTNSYWQGNLHEWYIGLVIGDGETGENGCMTLRITPTNRNGQSLGKVFDIPIYIRAVDTMNLRVVAKQEDHNTKWTTYSSLYNVNKAGNTITLAAYPHGYGTNGTEYYDIQVDSDNVACRWETKGHGEYKSPYEIKWTMKIGNDTRELSKWTEYIQPDSVKTGYNSANHAATVTFSLINDKTLPNGAVIRATSLHSLGEVDGIYYNKSGKNYSNTDDGVYAEIVVSSEFLRGTEYNFDSNLWVSRSFSFTTDKYTGIGGNEKTLFRVREVNDDGTYGEWTKFLQGREASGDIYRLNGWTSDGADAKNETCIFLPDKAYEVEFAKFVTNDYQNKGSVMLVWPYNETFSNLLKANKVIDEVSWNNVNAVGETNWSDFTSIYRIDKVGVTLLSDFGSESRYITTPKQGESEIYLSFALSNIWTNNYNNAFKVKIEKKVGNSWEVITSGDDGYVEGYGNNNSISVSRDTKNELALRIYPSATTYMDAGQYRVTVALKPTGDSQLKCYKINDNATTYNWNTSEVVPYTFEIGTAYIKIDK